MSPIKDNPVGRLARLGVYLVFGVKYLVFGGYFRLCWSIIGDFGGISGYFSVSLGYFMVGKYNLRLPDICLRKDENVYIWVGVWWCLGCLTYRHRSRHPAPTTHPQQRNQDTKSNNMNVQIHKHKHKHTNTKTNTNIL